jgi:hypothetical protein
MEAEARALQAQAEGAAAEAAEARVTDHAQALQRELDSVGQRAENDLKLMTARLEAEIKQKEGERLERKREMVKYENAETKVAKELTELREKVRTFPPTARCSLHVS